MRRFDEHLRVLVVEDNPGDVRLLRELFADAPRIPIELIAVVSLAAAHAALGEGGFDAVLLDLHLPDSEGLATLQQLLRAHDGVPVLVLSGANDEDQALLAVNAGAQDYLVKGQGDASSIHRAIRYAIERKRMAQQLSYLARHDTLTGLPNRTLLREVLPRALARSMRDGHRLSVLAIDLDHFKDVNDTLGHEAGDIVLVEVARRIRAGLRQVDIACRIGGDEFVAVLEQLHGPSDAQLVADKLVAAIRAPIDVDDTTTTVGASIGVAVAHEGGDTTDDLLRRADAALYAVKRGGRGRALLGEAAQDVTQLASELHERVRAAAKGQLFELYYQPIIDTDSGRTVGKEALLRLHDPVDGVLTGQVLLPVLVDIGMLETVGRWTLRQACDDAVRLAAGAGGEVTVNLSARQLRAPGVVADVAGALQHAGLDAARLQIDVDAWSGTQPAVEPVLDDLRRLGVRIGVDDYGAGKLTVAGLVRLPIDVVKLDPALVRDIHQSPQQQDLVGRLVRVATALEIDVVAARVEQEAERETLRALGCRMLQGFLVGRPEPQAPAADRAERGGLWDGREWVSG